MSKRFGFEVIHDPFMLVRDGKFVELQCLLENGLNVNQTRWSGVTCLHRAAENGQTDICQLLLQYGARINVKCAMGWHTPLHLALANGYDSTALFLVENGADPWIKNKKGQDTCQFALYRGYRDLSIEFRSRLLRREASQYFDTRHKLPKTPASEKKENSNSLDNSLQNTGQEN